LLRQFSGLFFLSLGTRLVNDDSPKCREQLAEALELLLKKLDNNPRQQLFDVVLLLLKDKTLVHREMAAQLIIRFVNAEGDEFAKRIETTLPALLESITMKATDDGDDDAPGKFVKVKKPRLENEEEDEGTAVDGRDQQTIEDHHLIQTLNAIIKLFEFRPALLHDQIHAATVDEIGYQAQQLLAHEHIWVRLRALQVINSIIKSLDFKTIEKVLLEEDEVERRPREFLHSKKQFRSVVFDMVVQLKPDVDPEVLNAIILNLNEVSKVIKNVPFAGMVNDKKDFNIMWLIRRLRYAIHAEIASTPSCCLVRKAIFGCFNSLLEVIDQKVLSKLASSLLTPMLREMAEGEHGIEELKQIALSVCSKIKNKIGLQHYDEIRLGLQSKMLRKRVDRRKSLAQEKINNPAKAATRTIVKQLKKQDMKKRKRQDIQDGIILPKKKRRIFGNELTDTFE
jgi:U3 small nucleolar RNA-associated protein 20